MPEPTDDLRRVFATAIRDRIKQAAPIDLIARLPGECTHFGGVSEYDLADTVIGLLDGLAGQRCRDTDCVRRLPHSRLARHLWRHEIAAPVGGSALARLCFTCGRPSWHRIHKTKDPA